MLLARIEAKNFLGLKALVLEPRAPVVLVCGENESGKSSLRDAVEYLLTGLVPARGVTTKKGAGVLASGKPCTVGMTFGDLSWERTPAAASVTEGELTRRFGDVEMLRACLTAWRFLDLAPKDRRELVRQVTCKPEAIRAAVEKLAADAGLPKVVEYLAETAAASLDDAEKHAVDMRRAAKRVLDELPSGPPAAKVTVDGKDYDLAKCTEEALAAKLTALGKDRDKAVEAYGIAKLAGPADEIEKRIEVIDKELFTLGDATSPAEIAKLLTAAHKAEADLARAREDYARAKALSASADERLAAAEKLKDSCPTCGQEVTKNVMEALTAAILAEGEAAEADLARLEKHGAELKAGVEAARKAHAEADKTAARYNEIQITLHSEKSALAMAGKFDELGKAVEAFDVRLAAGRVIIDAKRAYEAEKKGSDRRVAVEAEIAAWDAVATGLGPKGEVRKLAASGFDLAAVQEHADALLGREVAVDADWNVTLDELPSGLLSESARYRLGACFAAALAAASGLRFLVLDRLDVLDKANRRAALGWLKGLAEGGQFDTVIALATTDAPPPSQDWLDVRVLAGGMLA